MKCRNCGKTKYIYLPYLKEHLCKDCFTKVVEKRIRLNLRKKLLRGRDDKIWLEGNNAATVVVKHYLPKVFKEMYGSDISFKKKKGYKQFLCRSLEEECVLFFKEVLLGLKYEPVLNPTINVPQHELEEYCKIKDLKFQSHVVDEEILAFLTRFESARPGSMFGIVKVLDGIDNRLR
jgi:hypothetical protein